MQVIVVTVLIIFSFAISCFFVCQKKNENIKEDAVSQTFMTKTVPIDNPETHLITPVKVRDDTLFQNNTIQRKALDLHSVRFGKKDALQNIENEFEEGTEDESLLPIYLRFIANEKSYDYVMSPSIFKHYEEYILVLETEMGEKHIDELYFIESLEAGKGYEIFLSPMLDSIGGIRNFDIQQEKRKAEEKELLTPTQPNIQEFVL